MAKLSKIDPSFFVKSKHPENTIASYPAMPIVQNEQKFFLATIPVRDIFPFAFVSRRDEDPKKGFQRILDEGRALDIAKYLDKSSGSIPTNIVLSAQIGTEIEYNSRSKTIRYKRLPKSFLVIDGQHRLFGYGLTKRDHRVPVAIYTGLSRKDEAALFIDINTNQKGVPAALLLDIKQVAQRESDIEVYLRKFFDEFNKDVASPFHGQLSAHASTPGKISRVTFNKGLGSILDSQKLRTLSSDKQYTLINNYFKAIENNISETRLLFKSAYFEAFCDVFEETLDKSYSRHKNYRESSLDDIMSRIKNVDLSSILTGGRTKITKSAIVAQLRQLLSENLAISDDQI